MLGQTTGGRDNNVRPRCERKSLFALIGSTGDEYRLERRRGRYGLHLLEDLDGEFACWSSRTSVLSSFKAFYACLLRPRFQVEDRQADGCRVLT